MSDTKTPVFVNDVASWGFINGVANISFVTYGFEPHFDEKGIPVTPIPATPIVTANLRMDLLAVQNLREACDKILASNSKPAVVQ